MSSPDNRHAEDNELGFAFTWHTRESHERPLTGLLVFILEPPISRIRGIHRGALVTLSVDTSTQSHRQRLDLSHRSDRRDQTIRSRRVYPPFPRSRLTHANTPGVYCHGRLRIWCVQSLLDIDRKRHNKVGHWSNTHLGKPVHFQFRGP